MCVYILVLHDIMQSKMTHRTYFIPEKGLNNVQCSMTAKICQALHALAHCFRAANLQSWLASTLSMWRALRNILAWRSSAFWERNQVDPR